ncbi:MAG: hypothetical protein K2X60_12070 [Xanthobacteraceae bacterium]|nr:hypothetical protein [Xanthobacteraceae bacterium]
MALIGRLFMIAFGFLAACFVAGMVVLFALLFPEMELQTLDIDGGTMNAIIGFGFILVSGFALVPALFVVLITEAFNIRGILTYAILGGLAGLCSYLAFIPFDTVSMTFEGIVRRHLEIMVGAGILGGVVYWMIAGRNAGFWRGQPLTNARHGETP